jgi:hypothetical protein
VTVTSVPSGADITVDGRYLGSTPSKVEITADSHTILIQQAGSAAWQRTVTISPGEQISVNATLEKSAAKQ